MNKTDKHLTRLYVLGLVLMGLIALCFEVIAPDMTGMLFDPEDRSMRTVFETVCIISSIGGVYLALKLLSFPRIRKGCLDEACYKTWAIRRWALLFIPMILCLCTYYFFMSTNVVAFLGIGAICLLFTWPTRERREREMTTVNDNEEN